MYLHLIETAKSWGIRPSAVILGRDSRRSWDKWDILLANAHQILENERCNQCGLPRYICHTEDEGVHFDVEVDFCGAKQELARYEKNHGGKNGYTPPPGSQLRPVPVMEDPERDFAELRTPYYQAEAAKLEDPT